MRFSEKQGKEVVDWKKLLSSKDIDWDKAESLAGSWKTCPVGQLTEVIPRKDNHDEPIDEILHEYGTKFSSAIDDQDVEIALIWLNRINQRAQIVLNELKAELTNQLKLVKEEINTLYK